MTWLGTWHGWRVLLADDGLWLVNPLTGHRRQAWPPPTPNTNPAPEAATSDAGTTGDSTLWRL